MWTLFADDDDDDNDHVGLEALRLVSVSFPCAPTQIIFTLWH